MARSSMLFGWIANKIENILNGAKPHTWNAHKLNWQDEKKEKN